MELLRPLGVGELIDASIKIYISRWRTLLAAVAIPVVPVIVLVSLITWSAQPDTSIDPLSGTPTVDGGDLALVIVASLLGSFAVVIASTIATAACFRSISGAYVGDDATWRESLRFAVSRLWSVLGLTLLTTLAMLVGILLCCVGVLWPMAVFSVAIPVLLLEGQGVVDSMRRSAQLVKGMFWRVLGVVLLGQIIAALFQAVLSAPLGALLLTNSSPLVTQIVNVAVQSFSTVLVTPFTAALTMALYVDLRVRKEGFDLVLWAQRLGATPAAGFPAQPGARPEAMAYPGYPPQGYPPQQYPQPPYPPQGYPPQQYPPQAYPPAFPPPPPPPPPAPPVDNE